MYPPLTVELTVSAALPVFKTELATKTIAVFASPNDIASFDVCKVPPTLTWLGAVVVSPPLNVELSPLALPKVTYPVLENVTALVIVFVEPVKITL